MKLQQLCEGNLGEIDSSQRKVQVSQDSSYWESTVIAFKVCLIVYFVFLITVVFSEKC